ncbi:hypothetical protein BV898_02552 [Hypsibius exemplaris]|uniref:Receptor ligand binding region domain-containing protein n=1 Tax=Hypsibius exemplaris TaxID=2072580 RepID=A0A1W0X7S6_HYPEX|nr:hypothetical protein BV898_02552 [Hypsibius exemplaris]
MLGGNPAYEFAVAAPTYDVAFEDAEVTFPGLFRNVTRRSIFRLGRSKTCDDEMQLLYDALGEIVQTLDRLDGETIVQTPGCTGMATVLGDVAREMNFPLLLVAGGDVFRDEVRFRTVLGFGPADHSSLRDGAILMLRTYNWTTVSLLCGNLYQFAAPFDVTACSALRGGLRQLSHQFTVHSADFDPARTDTYEAMLRNVRSKSRVVILFCLLQFVSPLMKAASALNMTNGDYVFLSPQSSIFPGQLKRPWSKNDSSDDPASLNVLQSLIIYANEAPDWNRQAATVGRIVGLGASRYSTNISLTSVNALNIAAYDGFTSLAHVLNASAHHFTSDQVPGGTLTDWLVRQFYNRTFFLNSGELFLNSVGFRRVNVRFMRLGNSSRRDYETAWKYDVTIDNIARQSKLADAWPSRLGPPKNEPKCGFNNDKCYQSSGFEVLRIAIGGVAAVLLLGMAACLLWFRQLSHQGAFEQLDTSLLLFSTRWSCTMSSARITAQLQTNPLKRLNDDGTTLHPRTICG